MLYGVILIKVRSEFMKNKIFLFIIILLLILDVNVSAKGLFVGGNKVVVNEKKDGTSFIGGDKVKVESDTDIRGIAFIGGNEVNVSGQSDYLILFHKPYQLSHKSFIYSKPSSIISRASSSVKILLVSTCSFFT